MELNDTGGTAPVKSAYTGPVKCFDITLTGSSGGNEVRIGFTQSTDTDGKVAPYTSVAPFTTEWSGQVCFASANCPAWATAAQCTKVADTPGTPYDLQIQVSAGSTAATVGPFNVCVTKIAPVTDSGSTGTTNSCSSLSGQGTLVGGFDSQHVKCNDQDYIVQNNVWGSSASQTLTYGPGTTFKVTAQNGTGDTSGAPASYPSIFIGSNANRSTTGSGLPKAVSALGTVQTSWTWADSGASGTYNATYDVWFSTSSAGDPATATIPSAAYLMVWLYKPTGAQPNGSMTSSATIAGNDWNLWVGTSNGKPCYSYVALNKLSSVSFDLNLFIKDAVTRGYLKNEWGLTNVFSGFENLERWRRAADDRLRSHCQLSRGQDCLQVVCWISGTLSR